MYIYILQVGVVNIQINVCYTYGKLTVMIPSENLIWGLLQLYMRVPIGTHIWVSYIILVFKINLEINWFSDMELHINNTTLHH